MMPQQKPGKSKQDYQTPPELLQAVKQKLFIKDFAWDLAASAENTVCKRFYSEQDSALEHHNFWSSGGWSWCNPPYEDIRPWVVKAFMESSGGFGAQVAMLVPASVGSNWWKEAVADYCYQLFLNPRITFVGCKDAYPKDCAILLYTPTGYKGNEVWNWKAMVR